MENESSLQLESAYGPTYTVIVHTYVCTCNTYILWRGRVKCFHPGLPRKQKQASKEAVEVTAVYSAAAAASLLPLSLSSFFPSDRRKKERGLSLTYLRILTTYLLYLVTLYDSYISPALFYIPIFLSTIAVYRDDRMTACSVLLATYIAYSMRLLESSYYSFFFFFFFYLSNLLSFFCML